jgi:hypothetical protein
MIKGVGYTSPFGSCSRSPDSRVERRDLPSHCVRASDKQCSTEHEDGQPPCSWAERSMASAQHVGKGSE